MHREIILFLAIGALLLVLLWPVDSTVAEVSMGEPDSKHNAWADDAGGIAYTRGERNNNPGNIRPGAGFQGETGSAGGYATFDTAQNGIRACFVNLKSYKREHGINTIRAAVARWSKTDQAAYADVVSDYVGVLPDTTIDLYDGTILNRFVHGIIYEENGRIIYSDALINDAQNLA